MTKKRVRGTDTQFLLSPPPRVCGMQVVRGRKTAVTGTKNEGGGGLKR